MSKELFISPALDRLEKIDYRTLKEFQGKLKNFPEKNKKALYAVLFGGDGVTAQGYVYPICIWRDSHGTNWLIDGHQRLRIFREYDVQPYEIPTLRIEAKTRKEAKEKFLSLNSQYGQITPEGWAEFVGAGDVDISFLLNATTFENFALPDIDKPAYADGNGANFESKNIEWDQPDGEEIDSDILEDSDDDADPAEITRLIEKYIEPPFSVINGRSPRWMERKRKWNALGIASHVSREHIDKVLPVFDPKKYGKNFKTGASVFDPALAELLYKWFCRDGGRILDPFAGGSVRGIVAAWCGYTYTGIDIREEQIIANREQAHTILRDGMPTPEWICGDSRDVLSDIATDENRPPYDLIFSCPPYGSLEVYSDLDGDISNKPYDTFIEQYAEIIAKSAPFCAAGAFAIFVISDFRKKSGEYYPFCADTIRAFDRAGFGLWNSVPYLRPLASAPLRVGNTFVAGQKLVRVHEDVLIFRKRP